MFVLQGTSFHIESGAFVIDPDYCDCVCTAVAGPCTCIDCTWNNATTDDITVSWSIEWDDGTGLIVMTEKTNPAELVVPFPNLFCRWDIGVDRVGSYWIEYLGNGQWTFHVTGVTGNKDGYDFELDVEVTISIPCTGGSATVDGLGMIVVDGHANTDVVINLELVAGEDC